MSCCLRSSAGTAATPNAQGQEVCEQALPKHREKLAALLGGGQAKQYLGKVFTVDQINALGDAEIVKLYARYEVRLGAAMPKRLGAAVLQLHTVVASRFLPIENQPALVADLEADPFVGMHLVVLPASSTTVMACSWHR